MREATIHLSTAELAAFGLAEFVSTFRAAGLTGVRELQCQRPGCLLAITVREPVPPAELAALPDLEWWERLDVDEAVTYLCKVAVPAFDEGFDPATETEVSQEAVDVTAGGIDVTMVGDQDALADRVREYDETGADVLLRTLTEYDGPADPLDALTTRQREVLETAFDLGYFDVPRAATTADVGTELDLDPSTVREHLQRAQRNLVGRLLGAE